MTIYEGNNRTTSPYGMRWHPTQNKNLMHYGSDEVGAGSKNQRLILPEGVVEAVNLGWCAGRGNNVVVRQDTARGVVRARYQHNSTIGVKVGDRLKAGDIVGVEGSTGDSTGSHTHIEITVDGAAVDPSPWLGHKNAAGTYAQNDDVYDYGAEGVVPPESGSKLRVFAMAQAGSFAGVSSAAIAAVKRDDAVAFALAGSEARMGHSRLAREYAAETVAAVTRGLLSELQPGELLVTCDGYSRLFVGFTGVGTTANAVPQALAWALTNNAPFAVAAPQNGGEWQVSTTVTVALEGAGEAQLGRLLQEVQDAGDGIVAG